MADVESKKLSDLRVVDLKAELEKRGLDRTGKKENLVDRLSKALREEGEDPDTYLFEPEKKTKSNAEEDEKSEITEADSSGIGDKKDTAKVIEKVEDTVSEEVQDKSEETVKKESENDGLEMPLKLTLDDEETLHDDEADTTTDKFTNEDGDDDKTSASDVSKGEKQKATENVTAGAETKEEKDSPAASSSTGKGVMRRTKVPATSNPRVIWISNITKNTRASELKSTLSACGKVTGAKVVVNARFPGSYCFGYVTMATVEDADNVIAKLNNTELNGQMIKIEKFDNVRDEQIKQLRNGGGGRQGGTDDKSSSNVPKRTADPQSDASNQSKAAADGVVGGGSEPSKENGKSDNKQREERQQPGRDRSRNRSKERSRGDGGSVEQNRERRRSRGPRGASGNGGGGNSGGSDVLTFDKIKAERERQRLREKERQLREDSRRRQQEAWRQREVEQRQRSEAQRLEREREKLKMEREKIEREKAELIRMERERQRLEREKIKAEKIELERTIIRLSEDRRTTKRPNPFNAGQTYEDRKRPVSDNHFKEAPPPPRYDPPSKVSSSSYDRDSKHESTSRSTNRGDYHHIESKSHKPAINRNTSTPSSVNKYERPYESRASDRERVVSRGKDTSSSRYERDRSPHTFRPSNQRDREDRERDRGERSEKRPMIAKTSDIIPRGSDQRYHDNNPSKSSSSGSNTRFDRNAQSNWMSSHTHSSSSRSFNSNNASSSDNWQQKDSWRHSGGGGGHGSGHGHGHTHSHDQSDRWSSQHQSSSASMQSSCPPAPEMVTYPVRYDYNKPMNSGMRKY